jgi:2-phospho-L-lactate guanylyltransferase (CobY/MobA/RfbA family)
MAKFKVKVFEVHSWDTEIEATNSQEARELVYKKIKLGNDVPDSNDLEYSHTMNENMWDVAKIGD